MNIDYLIAEKWSGPTGPVPPDLFLLPTNNDDWDSLRDLLVTGVTVKKVLMSVFFMAHVQLPALSKTLTHAGASAHNTAWSHALTTRQRVSRRKRGGPGPLGPPPESATAVGAV